MKTEVLIIGAGQAGAMSSIALRQKKYMGSIRIIGEEAYPPYQRPPLSKNFLSNDLKIESLYIKSEAYYHKNKIELINNQKVCLINKIEKYILLENEKKYFYENLVITTGSILNKLRTSCRQEGIYYLRNIDDSFQIKKVLSNNVEIAIIGGGYIGLEVAASAVNKGLNVTVIEMEDTIMKRSVSSETSDFIKNKHKENGVNFLLNSSVKDITDHNSRKRIILNDNSYVDIDAVIIGIGIKPNIRLAKNANLICNNGIVVDENCRTSDKNIFAAGDCASHPNNIYQRNLRLESVHNAVEQAKTLASFINGSQNPYHQVPWFWSDQYNLKIQIAGISENYDEYVLRGDIRDEKFAIFYLNKKKIIAVEAINYQSAFVSGKKLIAKQRNILPSILRNENINLKTI